MTRMTTLVSVFMLSTVAVAVFANAQTSRSAHGGDAVGNGRSVSGPSVSGGAPARSAGGGGVIDGGGRSPNGGVVTGGRSSGREESGGRSLGREEGGGRVSDGGATGVGGGRTSGSAK